MRYASTRNIILSFLAAFSAQILLTMAHGHAAPDEPRHPLITKAIDETRLVSVAGSLPNIFVSQFDAGAASDSLPLEHLQLQLQRPPEQEAEVRTFVSSLYDPQSPNFHNWVAASTFGSRFGVHPSDVTTVTYWLSGHGFTIHHVYPNAMVIDFSGTAGQIRSAFHTEIHKLNVNGIPHISNNSEIMIPEALQPVVAGVVSLNDFRPHAKHHPRPALTYNSTSYCGGPCYLVTPPDLAIIYNFKPLFGATPAITGKGQSIAVVEDSNLYSNTDWVNFEKTFGLSSYGGKLATFHPPPSPNGTPCTNPQVTTDDDEATLDAEWASAAAPGATIILTSCKGTQTTDGVTLALSNLVNFGTCALTATNCTNANNPVLPSQSLIDGTGATSTSTTVPYPRIISISYGECEKLLTATQRAFYYGIYQQAAAAGISVFVASGDSGPEDCDPNYTVKKTTGTGVDGWVSTPYDTAVGGTDFKDTYLKTNTTYWAAATANSSYYGSAKSYIPEIPWNDSCASTLIAQFNNYTSLSGSADFCNSTKGKTNYFTVVGGNGGPSTCGTGTATGTNPTCAGYPKPAWQSGVAGIPQDTVRDVPDVSMFAADGVWNHWYVYCFSDKSNSGAACTGSPFNWAGAGGTSFAAPIVAGIQALINQQEITKYSRAPFNGAQGLPNSVYYQLAATEYGSGTGTPPPSLASCSSDQGNAISGTCIFNNITSGDIIMPCSDHVNCFYGLSPNVGTYGVSSSSNSSYQPSFVSGSGYNLATGLGSINTANLVSNWPYKSY